MSNLFLSTPQTENDAVCKRLLLLLVEKIVEVLATAVETGSEGLVLSFEKVQIAILCLLPHLLQEYFNSSVIWQKGESQNGGNKNTKHAKFSEKQTFFTPPFFHHFHCNY